MDQKLKFTEVALAFAGVAVFGLGWLMGFWLWGAMPTQPIVDEGFTIPTIIHGRTIYMNSFYALAYNCLFYGGFVLFFCAVFIDFYKDPFKWRGTRR